MGDLVSLVRTRSSPNEIRDRLAEALELIDFKVERPVSLVAIKPNLCYYWDAATGYTTDPRVVAGLIDWVRETYGEDVEIKVAEADASAMRTKLAFLTLGYTKLAEEKKVELYNLSENPTVTKRASVNGRDIKFKVPKMLLEADLFINVPKLKIMRETKITCAMKNLFGAIARPRKVTYHPFLNEAIVGINKILHPHLTVVDGLIALGRFPIKLGLMMTSMDTFSIDWVASKIMGYNPSRVKFLKLAMKEKVGSKDGVETRGEDLEEFRKIFPKEEFISSKWSWAIQLQLLSIYFKTVKDVVPPMLQEE
jgi:uncharacterized protein (DUF362 family)